MKTRRLSEIDLARFAAIASQEALEHALRLYNTSGGAWSYNPVRASTSDIVAARTPLLGPTTPVAWDAIAKQIKQASVRGDAQAKANVEVGKVLFDASKRLGWRAANVEMGRLHIGFGESVSYWSDLVIEGPEGLMIPYFDHRRGNGLTNIGMRQIAFSMQHIWVRERQPDLVQAKLLVVRFPVTSEGRTIRLDLHEERDLLTYEELDARVRNVYETWARVSEEKGRERRQAGGGENPFRF